MSIASPKNREEFKQYILAKLGAPVLQINVADEQMDIAINDAFQYWNGRSHIYGTESMFLTFPCNEPFIQHFKSFENELVGQGVGPTVSAPGMVETLEIQTPGTKYPIDPIPAADTTSTDSVELETQADNQLETEDDLKIIIDTEGGSGKDLTVWIGNERTELMGLVKVQPYNAGTGYKVGDIITIQNNGPAGGQQAVAIVKSIKSESKIFGVSDFRTQNNFITLPDDVVGVTKVFHRAGMGMAGGGSIGGMIPGAAIGPMFLGSLFGGSAECNSIGYDIVSYVAMREYLATLNFLFFPPINYSFNPRTHNLHIDANRIVQQGGGGYIALECMVRPNPDVFPDVWNDLWLKEYSTALVQLAWGRNLTKFNNVQLPGGINLNGEGIMRQAMEDIKILRDRFSMDWADPPLDLVG
jgi:hypothetical protein